MRYVLDEKGNPKPEPDLMKWAKFFEDRKKRVVQQDVIQRDGQEILVSTVFLGLDHNFISGGPPILYETMIFGLPSMEGYQERYVTKEAALIGHAKALELARGK